MNERIHADIVGPDGAVAAISKEPIAGGWTNARIVREALAVVPSQPAPRAMKQPRKDTLREALRAAADRQEAIARERDAWRELAEREPETYAATPFPALALFALGLIVGALFGWWL